MTDTDPPDWAKAEEKRGTPKPGNLTWAEKEEIRGTPKQGAATWAQKEEMRGTPKHDTKTWVEKEALRPKSKIEDHFRREKFRSTEPAMEKSEKIRNLVGDLKKTQKNNFSQPPLTQKASPTADHLIVGKHTAKLAAEKANQTKAPASAPKPPTPTPPKPPTRPPTPRGRTK